ncbi:MAG TPA: hypothetical protein VHC68_03485 [Candidatus Paceibacterota bacterium]|nr:hypothetical protein [Candidatus Paceibacterota bacterium]
MDQSSIPTTPESDADIAVILRNLPAPVREFLSNGQCGVFAEAFMARYNLHADQAGLLEHELTALLMGLESPDEFVVALSAEGKLPNETVQSIVDDVNREIVSPLQDALRAAPKEAPQPPKKPRPVVPVLAKAPSAQPGAQMPKPAQPTPPKPAMPQVSAPMRPPLPKPSTPPANPGLAAALAKAGAPPANLPGAPRPAALLEDHEEPHISLGARPPAPAAPRPVPQTPPAPQAARLQWNAPPKPPTPPAPPMPRPAMPPPQNLAPKPPPAPPAPGIDPYREPIDDK